VLEDMLGSFLASTQGQQAAQALGARGIGQGQIQQILSAAFPAAASSLGQQARSKRPDEPELGMFDLLGGHPGQAFLIGAATSMLRGEGMMDAAQDGVMSVVGAHVAEVIASRVGLDRQTAAQAAAAITPFLAGFVQDKLSRDPAVTAKRGEPTGGTWQEKYAAKHGGMAPQGAKGAPIPEGMPQGKPMQAYGDQPGPQGKPMQQGQGYGEKPMQGAGHGEKPMPGQGYGTMPQGQPMQGKPMPMQGKPMPMQGKPMQAPQKGDGYGQKPMQSPGYGQQGMPQGKPMIGKPGGGNQNGKR
jgi:hypothetical protein